MWMSRVLGEGSRSIDRTRHDVHDLDGVANGLLSQLDARELHQVVDRPGDPMRFGDHPFRHSAHDVRVALVGQRLGEHSEGADRRLQLVADVGDEVGAHSVDSPAFADVLDRRHRRAALKSLGRHDHGDPRRTVQLEQLARRAAVEGLAQGGLNGVVDEQAGVRPGHRLGARVAVQHLPVG